MATHVPSSCGCPSLCVDAVRSVMTRTRCGGPEGAGRLILISLWPPARSPAQPCRGQPQGTLRPAVQMMENGWPDAGGNFMVLVAPPSPFPPQAARPRSQGQLPHGLWSPGKAREARRLPAVARNSHCSPGTERAARRCSLTGPDSSRNAFTTARLIPHGPQPGSGWKPG